MTGRPLEDDGSVLLRFREGARGVLWASQIATGEENGLAIRVYGEKGSLEWRQQEPNTLHLRWEDKAEQVLRAGRSYLGKIASANCRLPAGHPEGFLEGFANLYASFADALRHVLSGKKVIEDNCDYPNIADGLRGMAFLDAVVRSSRSSDKWVKVTSKP